PAQLGGAGRPQRRFRPPRLGRYRSPLRRAAGPGGGVRGHLGRDVPLVPEERLTIPGRNGGCYGGTRRSRVPTGERVLPTRAERLPGPPPVPPVRTGPAPGHRRGGTS